MSSDQSRDLDVMWATVEETSMERRTLKSETTDDMYSAAASSHVVNTRSFETKHHSSTRTNTNTHCLMTHFSLKRTRCAQACKNTHTNLHTDHMDTHTLPSPRPHKHTQGCHMLWAVAWFIMKVSMHRERGGGFRGPNSLQRSGDQSTHTTNWPQVPLAPTMHHPLTHTDTQQHPNRKTHSVCSCVIYETLHTADPHTPAAPCCSNEVESTAPPTLWSTYRKTTLNVQ